MSKQATRSRILQRALVAFAVVATALPASATTYRTTSVIDTTGPVLVDTQTRIVREDGRRFEETTRTFRTDTTKRTTTRTSSKVVERNTARYDYDVSARFRDTSEKWYNGSLSEDSAYSTATRRLSWGSGSQGQSSYTFGPGSRDDQRAAQRVNLGQFVHRNNVIKGGIDDTVLDVSILLDVDGAPARRFGTSFFIDHAETWDWGRQGGVPDTFTISDQRRSWDFGYGDTSYRFSLLGFHEWFGGYSQAATVAEGSSKSLNLLGVLESWTHKTVWDTSFTDRVHTAFTTDVERFELAAVPVPAGAPLLLGALGVMAVIRKRRSRQAA